MGRTNKNAHIQLFDYMKQSGVVKTSSKTAHLCNHSIYKRCKHGKLIADVHVTLYGHYGLMKSANLKFVRMEYAYLNSIILQANALE
jgi:hypothetical protein